MIEQYLPNNNEKRYSVILPIFFLSKPAHRETEGIFFALSGMHERD
jgi:hypothetical protein